MQRPDASATRAKGKAIYNEKIRHIVEADPSQKGRVVVIDIYTGEYEIDDNDWVVLRRLLDRCPDVYIWAERVGYPALYEFRGPRLATRDYDPI